VALNLARSGRDREPTRRQHPVEPSPLGDRERRVELDLAIGAEQLGRELVDAEIYLGGHDLDDRAFRARRQSLELACDLAQVEQPKRTDLARELRDLLANVVVLPRGVAVAPH